ncbi:MAG: hypothetical protein N3E42_00400 [Candidatus Bipolaricaulota bacterium]|nr:hypothetical protein [Candidatus Bipolaricaulota bacterium]
MPRKPRPKLIPSAVVTVDFPGVTGYKHRPAVVVSTLVTLPQASVRVIGRLSTRDWQEIQARLRQALAIS